ncbi:hypothetical protein I2I05_18595 [Hymenobacter sp. BT683]|uniref:Outer membrane protein beta-barrel domain-containing protein n=1 Tax=Hymenobacter jeongseonensis TaxID=2791027 RepID=A0ABS0IM15_9BACT|nr:hypothetical protein [Hymenobacter jeongseonensis]MBF9239409.1 hypothetical protein [Hymenobacter jeongseonensis]
MKTYFPLLALVAGGALACPVQAQVSKFHGSWGAGVVSLRSRGPMQANPNNYAGITPGYVLKSTHANLVLLNGNLGFDAPLLQMSGGEQSFGLSLNATAGLLGTTRQDIDGFNRSFILDFPEYVTYRYGAKASKHSQKTFGVGVGLGYRFCKFFLPFNSPSAMLEGVYAADSDWFLRLTGDLRPTRFYNYYSSEGPVEVLRIREFNMTLGKSF